MRAIITIAFVLTLVRVSTAQQPAAQTSAPAAKTFTSAAEVESLIAKAKADRKPGEPTVAEPILLLAPYNLHLEYRASVGPAAVHEHEAEIFYVLDGSGTIVTGGKLVKETRSDAENLNGTEIEGGTSQAVAKGDFIMVPENTPHWFSTINGTLVLVSVHVPHPIPSSR
jgi:mannose-6-phosphate isomerase-like protein (cupin superfamily)